MGSRVLLVDDHAAFRAAAQALLQAEGFDVVADVGTAIEALKAVRRHHPDVVLLDVRLPDEDGITLAGHLAVLHPRPEVVLLSSRPASVYGSRLRAAPARGFLVKSELSGAALSRLLSEQSRG